MAHKIYPHKSQFNFYYELEFIKTAEDFTKEAAKYTNQDAKDQGALVYFKYEGDKLGTILLFDLADKQVSFFFLKNLPRTNYLLPILEAVIPHLK